MTTSAQLRDLAVAVLKGATAAGQNVYALRTWPTSAEQYPMLLVKAPKEHKESLGRSTPEFTTTLTMGIIARVKVAALPSDAGALQAEQALETIQRQIEMALINNPALTSVIQQFSSIDSEMEVSSEGDDINGQLVMTLVLEFYQGPEDFYPIDGTPLSGVTVVPGTNGQSGQTVYPVNPPANPNAPATLTEVSINDTNLPSTGIDITLPQ